DGIALGVGLGVGVGVGADLEVSGRSYGMCGWAGATSVVVRFEGNDLARAMGSWCDPAAAQPAFARSALRQRLLARGAQLLQGPAPDWIDRERRVDRARKRWRQVGATDGERGYRSSD